MKKKWAACAVILVVMAVSFPISAKSLYFIMPSVFLQATIPEIFFFYHTFSFIYAPACRI